MNMGELMELATGYWKSAVLSAGVELGIFEKLSNGPASANDLAGSGDPRYWAEVLDALSALHLLTKDGDRYHIAPEADPWLNSHSETCMLDALRYNLDLYPLWGQIAQSVRAGAPALPPGAHLGTDTARTRRFVLGMHSRALGLAPLILPALDPRGATNLLDIAAGPGTFTRLLAEQYRGLAVTQFDLPAVIEVARTLRAESIAVEQIKLISGDYRTDDLPSGFDMACLCGAIHQEDDTTSLSLFRKVKAALNPGGRFLIVDFMLEADRGGPLFSNLFSINMMLTSPRGQVHSAAQLEEWLTRAGFGEITLSRPPHSPYWVLEAS
jgi:SAM-dependent methyltransferase